jgi:hypothetical protein
MDICICNSCDNLKSVLAEDGQVHEYSCEFGFPSENCTDCDEETCNETCLNYMVENEETELKTVYCKVCGKKLEQVLNEETDGDIYCIDCYLKME